MGRAASLLRALSPARWILLAVAVAATVAWSAAAGHLPNVGLWPDVLVIALVLFPATFGVVWLALPVRQARAALPVAAVCLGLLAWALDAAGAESGFNAAKLGAYALAGFWFMELFEVIWAIVVVALIIPIVDSLSVWRGPTKVVVEQKPGLFERISVGFRFPGEEATSNIGPPDVLFFALFLAAAARFRLRLGWTFVGMVALLGVTVAVTAATDRGLPALPAIALGFLLPNVDLLLAELRAARRGRTSLR